MRFLILQGVLEGVLKAYHVLQEVLHDYHVLQGVLQGVLKVYHVLQGVLQGVLKVYYVFQGRQYITKRIQSLTQLPTTQKPFRSRPSIARMLKSFRITGSRVETTSLLRLYHIHIENYDYRQVIIKKDRQYITKKVQSPTRLPTRY